MSGSDGNFERCAHQALDTVEHVLARKQQGLDLAQLSEQFSRAIRAVVELRNHAADACRGSAAADGVASLGQVNALLSVMASIEYPLAGIHWPRIEQVRDRLRQITGASD